VPSDPLVVVALLRLLLLIVGELDAVSATAAAVVVCRYRRCQRRQR
jgi:hypothetical protein